MDTRKKKKLLANKFTTWFFFFYLLLLSVELSHSDGPPTPLCLFVSLCLSVFLCEYAGGGPSLRRTQFASLLVLFSQLWIPLRPETNRRPPTASQEVQSRKVLILPIISLCHPHCITCLSSILASQTDVSQPPALASCLVPPSVV